MSQMEGLHSDPALSSLIRPIGTPIVVDSDVFPPARSRAPDHSLFLPFIPEDIAFEEEYEEYLSDLGWADDQISADNSMFTGGTSAWHRLPNFVSEMTEGMETDPGSQAFIRANSPIPRMGELHELDGALLLLASPAGSFITGHSLLVDGG